MTRIVVLFVLLGAAAGAGPEGTDCPEPAGESRQREAFLSYLKGQRLLDAGSRQEAEQPLLVAARLDPSLAVAHYGLGQTYMALKRYPEAVKAFTDCREAFRCASLSLANRLEIERLLDGAIAELRDGIRKLERLRMARSMIAWQQLNGTPLPTPGESALVLQQLEKRLSQLLEWKQRLTGSRPPAEVSLALGSAHFHAGSLEEAERAYRAALEADSRSGDAHNNLAVVYMLTGRIEEAEREVRLAEKAGVKVNPRLREEIHKRKEELRRRSPQ